MEKEPPKNALISSNYRNSVSTIITRLLRGLALAGVWSATTLCGGATGTWAAVVSLSANNSSFLAIDESSVNDFGAPTGEFLFIGADNVTPISGTTGKATSSDNSYVNYNLPFHGNTAFPNQISTGTGNSLIPYDPGSLNPAVSNPNLLQPWTLTFTNSSASNSPYTVTTPSAVGYSPAPFATNVTIQGNGTTTPMVSWTGIANGAFVNIIDKNQCSDATAGTSAAACTAHGGWPNTILSRGSLPSSGSLLIPSGAINTTDHYVLQVAESVTRDRTANTSHPNEAAISRANFDFTVLPSTAPSGPIYIPTADAAGTYHFAISGIAPNVTYNIDPKVATGYIYKTGIGDPNFASVELPNIGNSGPYDLYLWNGTTFVFDVALAANSLFDFAPGGVSEFEVLGIDPQLGLDPSNSTAFITSLTFENAGSFTGTMTPVTTDVPEPASFVLLAAGLYGVGIIRRRTVVRKAPDNASRKSGILPS